MINKKYCKQTKNNLKKKTIEVTSEKKNELYFNIKSYLF